MQRIKDNMFITTSSDIDDSGLFREKPMIIIFEEKDAKILKNMNAMAEEMGLKESLDFSLNFSGKFYLFDEDKKDVLQFVQAGGTIKEVLDQFSEITHAEGLIRPKLKMTSGSIALTTEFSRVPGTSETDQTVSLKDILNASPSIPSAISEEQEHESVQTVKQ